MPYEVKELNVNPEDLEQLGTKEKFWFSYGNAQEGDRRSIKWLFKYSRANTGEHWSEKIAEQMCKALFIPHAQYDMACVNSRMGVVTPNIIPETRRMVMGNEVLHKDSPAAYPDPEDQVKKIVRIKEHTINRVLGCLDKNNVQPPDGWDNIEGLNAGDVFCGYLMLDALISNQDRHHENWAIVIDLKTQEKYLCETYDHAASLGRELLDTERTERMHTKDVNRRIISFVSKARSELFKLKTDKKPMLTVDAFFTAVEKRETAKNHWLGRLKNLTDDKIVSIFDDVPDNVISDVARTFALNMVLENKKRLLTDERA
ncbi:hypothetical protein [Shewanella sp. 8A]|nr:hypothetical protein [Shewanella sp. 8A]